MRTYTVWFALLLLVAVSSAEASVEAVEDGIRFSYFDPNAGTVFLAGAFNGWNASGNPMVKDGDTWSVTLSLSAGTHEYKFVVDGQWVADPENPVTAGEFGNSVVKVGADGKLAGMEATSNTPYSPKIFLGGRVIGLFISRENEVKGDRYELNRPTMDFDLDWKIRVNDVMDMYLVTKINNENEPSTTDYWKTNLHFDRGLIDVHGGKLRVRMFDNWAVGRFDDPLALLGGIGIYDFDFGYDQQGLKVETNLWGADFTLVYSDDFENGGTENPLPDTIGVETEIAVFDSTTMRFRNAGAVVGIYDSYYEDNDKDVLAFRVKYPLAGCKLGASARIDRGYNPGSMMVFEADGSIANTTGSLQVFDKSWELWRAGGGDIEWGGGEKPYVVRAEILHGRAEIQAVSGTEADIVVRTDSTEDEIYGDVIYSYEIVKSAAVEIEDRKFEVDRSNRFYLGGEYKLEDLGLGLGLSWERETHAQTYYATSIMDTLDNTMDLFTLTLEKEFTEFLGRSWTIAIEAERFAFDYDTRTPWGNQLWFDYRNFWMGKDDHEVSPEKLVLLGGGNAFIARPTLSTTLWDPWKMNFVFQGTCSRVDLDKKPKFMEGLFQIKAYPRNRIRLYSDTRIATYDDPVLNLDDTYLSTFFEIAYEVSNGIEISLSFGVDPIVVDRETNQYSYQGRDDFLFEGGANGDVARRNYMSLAKYIPEAEKALENERRIQIEGIVRF